MEHQALQVVQVQVALQAHQVLQVQMEHQARQVQVVLQDQVEHQDKTDRLVEQLLILLLILIHQLQIQELEM